MLQKRWYGPVCLKATTIAQPALRFKSMVLNAMDNEHQPSSLKLMEVIIYVYIAWENQLYIRKFETTEHSNIARKGDYTNIEPIIAEIPREERGYRESRTSILQRRSVRNIRRIGRGRSWGTGSFHHVRDLNKPSKAVADKDEKY